MTAHLEEEVKAFVRHVLGCGCPDEVFSSIRVEGASSHFAGLPVDYTIDVGGRLLVLVCATHPWQDAAKVLGRLVSTGRQVRERQGFNRVRLVVATDQQKRAAAYLPLTFRLLLRSDDRIHLHVIAPDELPDIQDGLRN